MSSRKRSVIWNHFTEVEPKKAKCSYCSNFIAISGGNVGNLNRHLKSKHPTVLLIPPRQPNLTTVTVTDEKHEEIASHATDINAVSVLCPVRPTPVQQAITDFVQNMRPIGPRRTEKIDAQLLKMIAKGHHPFSIVDEPEFKKLLTLLCPGYSLPTRKTIAENHLPKLYRSELEKAKLKVAAAPAVCLTTDGWTSQTNEHFIAITAHYVEEQQNKNLVLQSTMLGCVQYPDRTTATNLAEHMRSVMREWDIEYKVTAIASDNASNITAAIRSGDWRHIPCFAHTINLCIQSALVEIADTTKSVKKVVEYFKRSSHASAKLKEIQGQLNIPQLKLKQDVVTRWNSTYDMFRRILLVKDAVTATLALTKSEIMLSSNDWATIEAAVPILKIFYEVTVEISAEKNVTLSKIIPLCCILSTDIRKQINKLTDETIPSITKLLQKLNTEFDGRFNLIESSVLHTEAALLDPRFKEKGFRNKAAAEKAISGLKLKVGRSRPQQEICVPQVQVVNQTESSSSQTSLWEEFDKEVAKLTPSNPTAAGIVEFEKYLQEPLLKRTCDPFVWWNERRFIYPLLFHYMQKRLNIVATSVPCERIFSKAGNILTQKRSQLKGPKVSQLLFISCNTE